jgi:hypothetical protein
MGFALGEALRQFALAVQALLETLRLALTGQLGQLGRQGRSGPRRASDEGELARRLRRARAARRLKQRLATRER